MAKTMLDQVQHARSSKIQISAVPTSISKMNSETRSGLPGERPEIGN